MFDLSISIVNHRHGAILSTLLTDLGSIADVSFELLLTHNVEDTSFDMPTSSLPYPVRVYSNAVPVGFGANHNQAFRRASGRYFLVLNPDIRMPMFRFGPLLEALNASNVGACAPLVLEADGTMADHARRFPTLASLLSRVLLGRRDDVLPVTDRVAQVDWVAGMFMLFKREAFDLVGGFDAERYFLYYEDVDICRRLYSAGWSILRISDAAVIHNAQRSSHRHLRYMWWHVNSAVSYLWRHR